MTGATNGSRAHLLFERVDPQDHRDKSVRCLIYRWGVNPQDAEDLYQQALVELMESDSPIRKGVDAYFTGILHNLARQQVFLGGRYSPLGKFPHRTNVEIPPKVVRDSPCDMRDIEERIQTLLHNPRLFEIFRRMEEGQTWREIGEEMGIPLRTVRFYSQKIRYRLRPHSLELLGEPASVFSKHPPYHQYDKSYLVGGLR